MTDFENGMYHSLNEEMHRRFGCKMYKIALDGGMTCPNRDGTRGYGGCIFCDGSGAFAQKKDVDIGAQIEKAIERVRSKNRQGGFIAYFQSFTNTYAPTAYLRKIFSEAIADEKVKVLSIGTRPDCLGDEVLELLQELNQIKPVWIELGLQTIHPQTAEYIRRGYPLEVYDQAVTKLRTAGIETIVHMILGLPGESREMMIETARYIGRSGVSGIKLHLLHVLRGTDLAQEYAQGQFRTLEMEEYFEILCACLQVLPPEMVIHRLTGDGAKKDLIAPLWSADKKRVLNSMQSWFRTHHLIQGQDFFFNSISS